MIEEENVAEEIQQEVVQPDQEETPNAAEAHEERAEESDKERNFRELRESKRQLEREVREMRDQMERFAASQRAPATPQEEEWNVSDDDLVEGKHLKRVLKEMEKRLAQAEAKTIPDRLKAKFSDFDSVVTPENVEKLKKAEPELYSSIVAGNDLYAKGISAYKALKRFGIVQEDPYASERETVKKAQGRPVSTQAIKGQGALHEANAFAKGLTPELRKKLYEEMTQYSKGQ